MFPLETHGSELNKFTFPTQISNQGEAQTHRTAELTIEDLQVNNPPLEHHATALISLKAQPTKQRALYPAQLRVSLSPSDS